MSDASKTTRPSHQSSHRRSTVSAQPSSSSHTATRHRRGNTNPTSQAMHSQSPTRVHHSSPTSEYPSEGSRSHTYRTDFQPSYVPPGSFTGTPEQIHSDQRGRRATDPIPPSTHHAARRSTDPFYGSDASQNNSIPIPRSFTTPASPPTTTTTIGGFGSSPESSPPDPPFGRLSNLNDRNSGYTDAELQSFEPRPAGSGNGGGTGQSRSNHPRTQSFVVGSPYQAGLYGPPSTDGSHGSRSRS